MTKDKEERHDRSWRVGAIAGMEGAIYQANRAIQYLKDENDYFGQIHGHSALKMMAESLSDIAAAVERRRTQERKETK